VRLQTAALWPGTYRNLATKFKSAINTCAVGPGASLRKQALLAYSFIRTSKHLASSIMSSTKSKPTIRYPAPNPAANFFDAKQDKAFWENYLAVRPVYSSAFYDLIFAYHSSHNAHWTFAHDVGTGPGNVADVLASRFDRVIASDASPQHAAAAQDRNGHHDGRVNTVAAPAEDLAGLPGSGAWLGKTDMITAAECIPIMDIAAAMRTFHALLVSGGTLAVWFYGRPIFLQSYGRDAAVDEVAQAAYDKLPTKAFGCVRPQRGSRWEDSTNVMASWLENIPIDYEEHWANVKRYNWNRDREMCFFDEAACDFEWKMTSLVDNEKEEIVETIDRTIFAKEWAVEDAKGFVKANLPAFMQSEELWESMEPLFKELEEALGGKDSTVTVTWPVTLILATKK
jgi:trans-aconitate 3-methyltransferase